MGEGVGGVLTGGVGARSTDSRGDTIGTTTATFALGFWAASGEGEGSLVVPTFIGVAGPTPPTDTSSWCGGN